MGCASNSISMFVHALAAHNIPVINKPYLIPNGSMSFRKNMDALFYVGT